MPRTAGPVSSTTHKLSVVRSLDDRNVISAMRDELPAEWRALDVITTDRLLSGDLSNGHVKNGGIRFAAYGEAAQICQSARKSFQAGGENSAFFFQSLRLFSDAV